MKRRVETWLSNDPTLAGAFTKTRPGPSQRDISSSGYLCSLFNWIKKTYPSVREPEALAIGVAFYERAGEPVLLPKIRRSWRRARPAKPHITTEGSGAGGVTASGGTGGSDESREGNAPRGRGRRVRRFRLLSEEELQREPPMEWLVDGVLPALAFPLLHGDTGSGKTFLLVDLVCAVASGARGLRTAALPLHFTPHSLRHTYASILISEGVSPAYLQRQLGHATYTLTVDTYGKWLPMGAVTWTASMARVVAEW